MTEIGMRLKPAPGLETGTVIGIKNGRKCLREQNRVSLINKSLRPLKNNNSTTTLKRAFKAPAALFHKLSSISQQIDLQRLGAGPRGRRSKVTLESSRAYILSARRTATAFRPRRLIIIWFTSRPRAQPWHGVFFLLSNAKGAEDLYDLSLCQRFKGQMQNATVLRLQAKIEIPYKPKSAIVAAEIRPSQRAEDA
ncbi:hypothetical protein EVAR_57189_1 [Eumeta japonica]|uniref:Uncharacterized protein n=1 Tax=Eumeta variegata TaxID=151549 RepID=A0A4C1Z3D2_EUMVA|nr:hypothetical protein EVAR_57189_1 [Eumeta japonica]